ncbi:PTS mannose/fructose/sorbose transporter subunit IIB [Alicyclobacillaceae bacterium I2511]|nr:PTS mannose/fructose/sorbose transporter subunit IIB [Alicyclobacillaceae bacterium I2511]
MTPTFTTLPFIRVDDRLIHGQVVTAWVRALRSKTIWVVSDRAAAEPIEVTLLKNSISSQLSLEIFRVAEALATWRESPVDKLFVLTEGLKEIIDLFDGGFPIGEINIGGIRYRPGYVGLNRAVYIGSQEAALLSDMQSRHLPAFIRIMPNDGKIDVYERTKRKWG